MNERLAVNRAVLKAVLMTRTEREEFKSQVSLSGLSEKGKGFIYKAIDMLQVDNIHSAEAVSASVDLD